MGRLGKQERLGPNQWGHYCKALACFEFINLSTILTGLCINAACAFINFPSGKMADNMKKMISGRGTMHVLCMVI